MSSISGNDFRIGNWTVAPLRGAIIGPAGEEHHLQPKVMDVLVCLASQPFEPLTRDQLLDSVWGNRFASDETLTRVIAELRQALGDDARHPEYIETIPKRGYRFLVAPTPLDTDTHLDTNPNTVSSEARHRALLSHFRPVSIIAALGILALSAAIVSIAIRGSNPPDVETIAVIPFDNMSADPEQEYLSDGISEEILNRLAQIESLKVIARHTSFSFKGKDVDITTMAEQMNVRHILEGSVRRSGDRLRITAKLIDAKDSSHVWSESYDRAFSAENLFQIQSEIARAITDRLRMTLTGDDEKRLAKVPTQNTEAYAAYLLGRERLKDRKVAELADAVEQFSLAIELDPQFSAAYSGLADACSLYDSFSGGQSNELCPSSLAGREQLSRKALELDPESAEAWISLGTSTLGLAAGMHEDQPLPMIRDKLREAIAAFERGLELNPTLSEGYHLYGYSLMWVRAYPDPPFGWIKAWQAGRWESVFDDGLEVDPLSIPLHQNKSWYPITVSSKEEAKWHGHRMIEIAPDSPRGYETVGKQEWELNGRIDESILWTTKAMEVDPQSPGLPESIGRAYSALGDLDMALAYFDLAKALTAPDAERSQDRLLVERAVVRLVAGEASAHQVGKLPTRSSAFKTPLGELGMQLGVFVDLTTGRAADALGRLEVFLPGCLGATEIPVEVSWCPTELVRVYQQLGDQKVARALSDANLRRFQLLAREYPVTWVQLAYAGTLATAGRSNAALEVLESLVASGWRGDHYNKNLGFIFCCDVVFDAIRDHERFLTLAATIKADMAQQLENVREMQRRGKALTLEEVNALIASAREGG